jgi:hypothetical protein
LSGALIALGAARGWEPRTGVLLAYTLPTLTGAVGILAASRLPAVVPARTAAAAASAG